MHPITGYALGAAAVVGLSAAAGVCDPTPANAARALDTTSQAHPVLPCPTTGKAYLPPGALVCHWDADAAIPGDRGERHVSFDVVKQPRDRHGRPTSPWNHGGGLVLRDTQRLTVADWQAYARSRHAEHLRHFTGDSNTADGHHRCWVIATPDTAWLACRDGYRQTS